jgi:hypothetical protein
MESGRADRTASSCRYWEEHSTEYGLVALDLLRSTDRLSDEAPYLLAHASCAARNTDQSAVLREAIEDHCGPIPECAAADGCIESQLACWSALGFVRSPTWSRFSVELIDSFKTDDLLAPGPKAARCRSALHYMNLCCSNDHEYDRAIMGLGSGVRIPLSLSDGRGFEFVPEPF